jgi:excisionase family DNA binding protein
MLSCDQQQGPETTSFMATRTIDREWLSLRELTEYAAVSERTLREWLHRPTDPLPGVCVRGKILVRRPQFDEWLEHHRIRPDTLDVEGIVKAVLKDLG